jgi:hypothetical protein
MPSGFPSFRLRSVRNKTRRGQIRVQPRAALSVNSDVCARNLRQYKRGKHVARRHLVGVWRRGRVTDL